MIDERFLNYLKKAEVEITEYRDIRDLSYIRIGTVAECLAYPDSIEKLILLLKAVMQSGLPYTIVGRMSNVLFKDDFYSGIIIKTDKIDKKYLAEDRIVLECGCSLPPVARQLAEYDLGGFEGLLGIPGSVGGMIRQNAGAFGYEISDRFYFAEIYDSKKDDRRVLCRDEMYFGYRTSILKDKNLVLLSATFRALQKPKNTFIGEVKKYMDIRRNSQPMNEHSLGSVFKKVDGVSAGYYIDLLGLKGFSIGGASVSKKHAGFIVNDGTATARDVLYLIDIIKSKVFGEFGIALEEEIEII